MGRKPYEHNDSKEDIQKCLSCELPACSNCLYNRPMRGKAHYTDVDVEVFLDMYNEGAGIVAMGAALGLDPRTVRRRLEYMEAPYRPGRRRIQLTLDHIRRLPHYVQAHFLLKGVPMA